MPLAPSTDSPTWSRDRLAERRGRFILGPELGRGGMGVVHLAWDPLLKRLVALKQLLHADPLQTLRFLREAQLQAKVEHPHVCKVFEVSAEGEQPYIAMQYVEGQSLGEARGLSLREKVRLFAEVANALHAAHRLGLIHRDLKPSNILLEHHGEAGWVPYLLDFGLARDLASADMTLTWGMVGTPAFMSPEQAAGEELSPAADLYSLGATFYAVFAGRPPFEATTLVGMLQQQAASEATSLRRILPGFPKDLETILLHCLESKPQGRYASAFALEEDLRRWLAGEPILARPTGLLGKAWRHLHRHRTLSLTIAAGLVVALGLMGWNVHVERRARIQVELAQRFGLQVREVEQLLRIERMLPVHDMRPAEAQVRQRMGEIQASMVRQGASARGPGMYALGRGHLALREHREAQAALEEAWKAGYRTPDVEYALGCALLEQYLPETLNNQGNPNALLALKSRFAEPALARLRAAAGNLQESPAFLEAQIALLEGDTSRCVERCHEAFRLRPWMSEAKLLEARALGHHAATAYRSNTLGPRLSRDEGLAAFCEARRALDAALAVSPSDDALYEADVSWRISRSILDADGGTPDLALFEEGEARFSQHRTLQTLRPDSRSPYLYLRIRHGFALMRAGRDVRPLMLKTLEELQAGGPQDHQINALWLLADGQYRAGEDPTETFRAWDRLIDKQSAGRIQPDILRAEWQISRGQNPKAVLDEAEQALLAGGPNVDSSFYLIYLWGWVHLTRAEGMWCLGQDPSGELAKAQARLEQSQQLNPEVVYTKYMAARVEALRAQAALERGHPADRALARGLGAARAALRVSRSHWAAHHALARIQWLLAVQALQRRETPDGFIQEGLSALKQGLALNPADFRLHLQGALLELTAARTAASRGASADQALARAEAFAQAGLRAKGDCARLWLTLARIHALRADQASQERAHAERKRALALNPRIGDREVGV